MLSDPLGVSPTEAASAASLIANFAETQRQFEACEERFALLRDALRIAWPSDWLGTAYEAYLRDRVTNYETVAEVMRANPDLTFENLKEGNESLWTDLGALDDLLQQANDVSGAPRGHAHGGGRSGGAKRTTPPRDEKELALAYFGFSLSNPPATKQQLREAWRRKVKILHPDANPGADDAEQLRLREEWNKCEQYFNLLLTLFDWHRPS
jgi:hypothetical protein